MNPALKILFFGSDEISAEYLEYIYEEEKVAGVVTAPPKPAGRGLKPKESPPGIYARGKGLPVFTPSNFTDTGIFSGLEEIPDLGVTVAYGKILPKSIIEYPKLGTINVHFSILPKYRGAAPIQRALINGEIKTGVTVFWLDEGMDTGRIIVRKETDILSEDTTTTLKAKLTALGIGLLEKAVALIKSGKAPAVLQEGAPSYAPELKKSDGIINWEKTSEQIINLIRGTYPWPGAHCALKTAAGSVNMVLTHAHPVDVCPGDNDSCSLFAVPGEITGFKKGIGFVVKCGKGFLLVKWLKPEGKKEMSAWDFIQGARINKGDKFVKI